MTEHAIVEGAGNIKGVAFREFADWYADNVSADHIRSVVETLNPLYPNVFDASRRGFGILATRWYAAELVHAFLDRVVINHQGADIDELTQSAANDIMNKTLSGVYKFLFSAFATPQLYARHANKLWSLHYDSGVASVETVTETEARARYTNWRGHHPLICRLNMSATVPIYRAMGCPNVRWTKVSCIQDGATACAMVVRWDPRR